MDESHSGPVIQLFSLLYALVTPCDLRVLGALHDSLLNGHAHLRESLPLKV